MCRTNRSLKTGVTKIRFEARVEADSAGTSAADNLRLPSRGRAAALTGPAQLTARVTNS